eukprot:208203-Hanusia_phi.AAC.1
MFGSQNKKLTGVIKCYVSARAIPCGSQSCPSSSVHIRGPGCIPTSMPDMRPDFDLTSYR